MTMQYQIQATKSEVEKLQLQVDNLLINAKEYDAPWLKEAGKVVRDASGKFAKSAGDAAKSAVGEAVSRSGASVERAVEKAKGAAKNAGAEAISRYGGSVERAAEKAGEIQKDVAAHASKVAADVKTAAGLLAASFAQKIEQVDKLSSDTKTKLSAILASPAVTKRMDSMSAAMGNISAEAKKGYDSAVAKIMAAKGNIGTQLNAAKDSASKVAASAREKAKPVTDAMEDMGAHVANHVFNSYVNAIMGAKNLAGIIAQGDAGVLKNLYSLPLADGKTAKDAITPLLEKMEKWANTAPKPLQDKYASTIKAIESGFKQSIEERKTANPPKTGDFENTATNA